MEMPFLDDGEEVSLAVEGGVVSLCRSNISWKKGFVALQDVIGASVSRNVLSVEAYPRVESFLLCLPGSGRRRHLQLRWRVSDAAGAEEFAKTVCARAFSGSAQSAPWNRNVLVFINPAGGTGKAVRAWNREIRPMFRAAGLSHSAVETTGPGHARRLLAAPVAAGGLDLSAFTGVVAIGGDGTLAEVLQGVRARADAAEQLARLRLGIVPAGSGNGLAKTVLDDAGESMDVRSAAFVIVRGGACKFDLHRYQLEGGGDRSSSGGGGGSGGRDGGDREVLGCLAMGWAILSDVDIESEAYRWMGPSARFAVGAVHRIIDLRRYRGRLRYLPVTVADECSGGDVFGGGDGEKCGGGCSNGGHGDGSVGGYRSCLGSAPGGLEASSGNGSNCGVDGGGGWVEVEDDFVFLTVAGAKWLAHDYMVAPSLQLGEGAMFLCYVPAGALTKLQMVEIFLGAERGAHVRNPAVRCVKVRAVQLEPLTSRGILTVDGERVAYGAVQVEVLPGAANLMCGVGCGGGSSGDKSTDG